MSKLNACFNFEDLKIRDLRYFVVIVESGSITEAANRLYIAQPSLSRKIHTIEEVLGTLLFTRGREGVTLTKAGQIIYDRAWRILREYDGIEDELALLAKPFEGKLRIGYIANLHSKQYIDIIEVFERKFPKGRIELVECHGGNDVMQRINARSIDLGYCSKLYVEKNNEIAYKKVELIRCHIVLKSNSEMAHLKEISLSQLVGNKLLFPDKSRYTAHVKLLEQIVKNSGIPFEIEYMENADTLLFLVRCGRGIGFLSSGFELNGTKDIISIPLAEDTSPRYRVIAWRKDNNNPGIVEFMRVLDEAAKKEMP